LQNGSNIEKVMEFEEEYRVWASVELGMLNDGEKWERVVPIIIRYHNDKCQNGCPCSRSKAIQYLVNLYQHQRFG
jgi:hypothetical protein